MPVIGDMGKLRLLQDALKRLSDSAPRQALVRNLAIRARSLIQDEFLRGVDPYGRPWAASGRSKAQGGVPLSDTGRLSSSVAGRTPQVEGDSFTISTNVAYAAIHNFGGTITQAPRKQTNLHRRDGRFMSRKDAEKYKRWGRVSFSSFGARTIHILRRQFIPEDGNLGPIWTGAFEALVREHMARMLKGAADAR